MQENTKSVSEFLRAIQSDLALAIPVPFELFEMPDSTSGASISIGEISSVQKTGELFKVKLNILCECGVSISEALPDLLVTEIAMNVHERITDNTFGFAAMVPENISNAPMGEDDRFSFRGVTWDQEVYVEQFDIKAP